MSHLKIIRASAGSGKTFSLTREFLEIVINEPTDYYRSILAVTFTNKATAEMKSRIVQELYNLASGRKSNHLEYLINNTGFKEEHIRNKSQAILQQILHGYSWFSIETIDTFFQRVLKAFARELAMPGNYNIELETEPALQFAIDNLLEEIEEGSDLLNWLIEFSEKRIEEGKVWDIKKELESLGSEVFKENFAEVSGEVYASVNNKSQLLSFKKYLIELSREFENSIVEFGKKGLDTIRNSGLEATDFYQGERGICGFFKKLTEKQPELTKTAEKMLEGPEIWPSPKSTSKDVVIQLAINKLIPLLKDIISYKEKYEVKYFTAKEILRNFYSLGILSDLAEKVKAYCHENNSFILSDSPIFINRIIDNNEAPFIYEKVGNRFGHFMIDEFQDTSAMQWNNFRPLVANSLANGKQCLVVGDVKQSIYRWRNSNWEILASQVYKDFTDLQLKTHSLESNWRSLKEIVEFNNLIYPILASILQKEFLNTIDANHEIPFTNRQNISKLYSETSQLVANESSEKGKIILRFFEKEKVQDSKMYYEESLLNDINKALEAGYSPGDIAILVRQKSEGRSIADLLIRKSNEGYFNNPVQVISNESLFLYASNKVNLLTAALQYLINPNDRINIEKLVMTYFLSGQNYEINKPTFTNSYKSSLFDIEKTSIDIPEVFINNTDSLLSLPLFELTERLISIFEFDMENNSNLSELPYIHGFLDLVFEFSQKNGSDISKFIEYWNEEGMFRSIAASDKQNAIQILTIHKSKGLEFKVVIIPCCNWKLNTRAGTILWANVKSEELSYSPQYPVYYSKSLLKTEFAPFYINEILKSYVDNLNLLYVSTTRAAETLIIYPSFKTNEKKENSISTIGDLLYEAIARSDNQELLNHYEPTEKVYETGSFPEKNKEKINIDSKTIISTTHSEKAIDRLFCRYLSTDYFTTLTSNEISPAKHGSVLHNILSEVRTHFELRNSFEKAVFEGVINKEESDDLLKYINNCLTDPLIESWFAPEAEIMNESDIILPKGSVKRPDRVVIYRDHVDIIDYKFGSESQEAVYRKQIEEYKSICSQMGYRNIKGYLWYITHNRIVEV